MKKITCVLLSLLIVFALAGCSSGKLTLPPIEKMNPDIVALHDGDDCCEEIYTTLKDAIELSAKGLKDDRISADMMQHALKSSRTHAVTESDLIGTTDDDRQLLMDQIWTRRAAENMAYDLITAQMLILDESGDLDWATLTFETKTILSNKLDLWIRKATENKLTEQDRTEILNSCESMIQSTVDYYFAPSLDEAQKIYDEKLS